MSTFVQNVCLVFCSASPNVLFVGCVVGDLSRLSSCFIKRSSYRSTPTDKSSWFLYMLIGADDNDDECIEMKYTAAAGDHDDDNDGDDENDDGRQVPGHL